MIAAILLTGACGVIAGFLLLWRVPLCTDASVGDATQLSVIVPARNEERSLPVLLRSLGGDAPADVIVVDDHSSDRTPQLARDHGAHVVSAPALPEGWTGKTWACVQGAAAAKHGTLLFLDADTWLAPRGLERMAGAAVDDRVAMSLLPFHITSRPYEELSVFFNLLMAFGAGGFGRIGRERLFGQSLLVSRRLYEASGTHEAVRSEILENFALASTVEAAGGRCVCRGGRGVLNIRMFPGGLRQLCEGWTKAFATGAARTQGVVLAVSIVWLAALCVDFVAVMASQGDTRRVAVAVYAIFAAQIAWMARQVGTFRVYTSALYPVPLMFFFALFARSAVRRSLGRQVTWRGRQL